MGLAGRDTFQVKTVRNREAEPSGSTYLPGNGAGRRKSRVLHSVIDKVWNWENLTVASRKVVRNKGSGGVDGMSVKQWREKEEKHLRELQGRLRRDTYRSKPALRCYIPKPGSAKRRPLGIPAVTDRVCQQAVQNVLVSVFEEYFHEDSHGFRPERSTQTAARRVEALRKQGYDHVVDLDIKGFYDHLNQETLMKLVRQVVKDRRVLRPDSRVAEGGSDGGGGSSVYRPPGLRKEGSTPLLSNIYLTPLDNALTEAGYRFVRYADDVVYPLPGKRRSGEGAAPRPSRTGLVEAGTE